MAEQSKQGIFTDMPDAEYFANPAISNSKIKELLRSPAHYKHSLTAPHEEKESFLVGSATHCSVLEFLEFDKRFYVCDEKIDKRTNVGKEKWKEVLKLADGKQVVTSENYEKVSGMHNAIMSNGEAGIFFREGSPEVVAFAEIEGVSAKAKFDWLIEKPVFWEGVDYDGIIVDLKTTDDARRDSFAKSIYKFGYDTQCAWYTDVAEKALGGTYLFLFVVVEKSAPHCLSIFQLDDASIHIARMKYRRALALYRECSVTGDWYGYEGGVQLISLPAWATKEYQNI
jgi:hypothetical protein